MSVEDVGIGCAATVLSPSERSQTAYPGKRGPTPFARNGGRPRLRLPAGTAPLTPSLLRDGLHALLDERGARTLR
jgi:hypothetical protein